MNLKTTLQTLRRIERLLDGWQSSGDIPAIERDLACDLLRRTYDDIFFSDKNVATTPKASLAENTPADRMNETAVSETAGTPVDAAAATGDAHIADVVSPVGLVGLAPSGKPAEETPEGSPENAEAVEVPAAENASSEMPAESPAEEDASVETSVEAPAAENASLEVPAESPAEEDASVETSVEAPTFVKESVEEPTSVKGPVDEPISVGEPAETPSSIEKSDEENISIGMSVGEPAGEPAREDTSVGAPVGDVAEEEIPVEEFGVFEKTGDTVEEFEVFGGGDAAEEFGEAGDAVEESGDTVSAAEVVADPIPETSIDVVIDPVFEVFNDEDEDAEKPDGAEESEDADAAENVGFVEAVNVMEAVESVGAAEDTEIEEEVEVMEEMEAEETEIEQPVAASAAIRPVTEAVEPAAESTAEPGQKSVFTHAPAAGTSAGEAPADAAASNTETLEEMASRFKNASGRRRKSRRAFLSLYDDDETGRRGVRNDQLELSDWGVEPSDPASNLRHARELFGLPVDDLDTTSEPTPQPAAEAGATDDEMEVEVIDFLGDDDLAQNDRDAKPAAESFLKPVAEPTSEPAAAPTQPTPRPAVAPPREERDDADDDLPFDEAVVALDDSDDVSAEVPHLEPLGSPEHPKHPESPDAESFDSIEIVEIADGDEKAPGIEEDEAQHTDRAEVADESAKSEAAAPAAPATEPAAVRGLYGREEKPELPASTTVLGEVMGHDVPTVGDSLGRRPDVAGWTGVHDDLNRAISVGDRFVLLRDLFDGDQALCDRTLKRLSTFDDLDDCMIWITENFAWNANSEGAKLIMGLLERKLG